MRFTYPQGATPLDPDTIAGLIPHLTTQRELNEFEARNILLGERWALRARGENRGILLLTTLRKLHTRMFDLTWRWAGEFRRVETNIGIPPHQIPMRLEQLCRNTRYQIENSVFGWDELAARFHHEMVSIHPFPNGNGRHARLAADLLLTRHGQSRFTWGSRSLVESSGVRKTYIAALQSADNGDYEPLIRFCRS
ncbi:MAG: mobile mystery protein B [Armatimonadetes bacterium]|nr:mobile mystery protein B [Armatimonadota bacterium]